ncbi:hypothetical protein NQZ68_005319 [Dissostichus eleginoides]|nr:hypothetical protein NQZ68_005319 [Dissostichus eleginoides]
MVACLRASQLRRGLTSLPALSTCSHGWWTVCNSRQKFCDVQRLSMHRTYLKHRLPPQHKCQATEDPY